MRKILLIFISLLLVTPACHIVHVYKGKYEIVNRTIASLNDSALIFGNVYSAMNNKSPEQFAEIWIDGTNLKSTADSIGYFSLKIPAGLCSIKCKGKYSNDNETVEIKDINVLKNEKIELKFFIGITID